MDASSDKSTSRPYLLRAIHVCTFSYSEMRYKRRRWHHRCHHGVIAQSNTRDFAPRRRALDETDACEISSMPSGTQTFRIASDAYASCTLRARARHACIPAWSVKAHQRLPQQTASIQKELAAHKIRTAVRSQAQQRTARATIAHALPARVGRWV
eukprot:2348083-Pleurochrysis_carterae.AAC.1